MKLFFRQLFASTPPHPFTCIPVAHMSLDFGGIMFHFAKFNICIRIPEKIVSNMLKLVLRIYRIFTKKLFFAKF